MTDGDDPDDPDIPEDDGQDIPDEVHLAVIEGGKGRKLPQSTTGKRQILAAERMRQAIVLRQAGLPYASIGSALGVSGPQAYRMVKKALERLNAMAMESIAELKQLELARLDEAYFAIRERVRAGNLGAIDRMLKIQERRARLLGLDAPLRTEIEQGPVEIIITRVDEWTGS